VLDYEIDGLEELGSARASQVFVLEDDVAKVIVEEVPPEVEDACREAAEDCPVDAIALED
ncbi:MAG: ferredoxin, partial [Thermoleophilia bacterium]|nr:ferredoxin [Thermoleophilia bacterium]